MNKLHRDNSTKLMKIILTMLLVCMALFHTTGLADTYKWIDDQGVMQYTQSRPPAGVEYTVIGAPSAVDPSQMNARIEQQKKYVSESLESKANIAEENRAAAEERSQRQKNCELGRDRLASWSRPRVQVPQADGSRIRASEEERQAQLQKSRDIINEFCD